MAEVRAETTIDLIANNAVQHGERPALGFKHRGIWTVWTWKQVGNNVSALAGQFEEDGLRSGDPVLVIGDSHPLIHIGILAAQWIGLVPVLAQSDLSDLELSALVDEVQPRAVISDGMDKIDQCLDCNCNVGRNANGAAKGLAIFYSAEKPLRILDGELTFHHLDFYGPERPKRHVAAISVAPGDCALRCANPGERADIAFSDYTHETLLYWGAKIVKIGGLSAHSRIFSQFPLAWPHEALLCHSAWLASGATVFLPESATHAQGDRREVSPTIIVANPCTEMFDERDFVRKLTGRASIRRKLVDWYMGSARGRGQVRPRYLSDMLVGAPLRDALGLGSVRTVLLEGRGVERESGFYERAGLSVQQVDFGAQRKPPNA